MLILTFIQWFVFLFAMRTIIATTRKKVIIIMEKKLNLCVYVCVCVCVCVIASAHHVQMVTLSARILLPWFILPDFSRFNSAGMNKYPLVSIAPGHQV